MRPVFFIVLVVITVFVGGAMIQTGLSNLAGKDGSGYFSVIPSLNINSLNLPPTGSGGSSRKPPTINGGGSSTKDDETVAPPTKIDLPDWVDASRLSPYFREVRMSSLKAGSAKVQGSVVIKSSSNRSDKINITGWQIKAKNGGIFIPQGVERYLPVGLSVEGDIRLDKGDQLTIYTTISPLGQNIRLNKCIGYLQEERKFSPALPKQCPRPDVDDVKQYSAQCIDYVRTISTCEVPKSNPPLPNYDYQCRQYLEQFNYRGCFGSYSGTPGFLLPQWRAWSGGPFLNPRHDRVLLLDRSGLIVDYREY